MTKYTDLLVAEVQYEHVLRLDTPTDDLVPKPYSRRRRPNTALISQACAAKAAARALGFESFSTPTMTKRKRPKHVRLNAWTRKLTLIEVCEFKAAVHAAIALKESPSPPRPDGLCAGGNAGAPFCWNPNCPRCMPA